MRPPQLATVARSIRESARRRGLARTLRLAAAELAFDLRHKTDTAIEIPAGDRAPGDERSRHEPVNPLVFRELASHLPLDPRASTFVDLGAGKGRALILAAELGFRRVIGVEHSSRLCAIARANRERCRHEGVVEVRQGDAARLPLPGDVDVIFLFDPFETEAMRLFARGLAASRKDSPSELYVVYANPRLEHLFVAAGFSPIYRSGIDGVVLRRRAASDE